MGQLTVPLDPQEPDLVLEPVIGWRMWRLRRRPGGALLLESPTRPHPWLPKEPSSAECPLTVSRGRSPHEGCACGLYAASSPERLRVSGVPLAGPGCSVVGTVAMWGRVIEHETGFRGELAYPDRIRLVCAPCLLDTASGAPTAVFSGPTGELMALCVLHAPDAQPLGVSPDQLQAQLLSTYAVDLLPAEALGDPVERAAVYAPGLPRRTRTLRAQARVEARELVRTVTGRVGIVTTIVLFFVLRALGVLTAPTIPGPTPAPVATVSAPVTPLPGTGDPLRLELTEPDDDGSLVFPLQFLCGELHGAVVTLTRCAARGNELLGGAVYPPESRAECPLDGYTRKGRYSVCWIGRSGGREPPPRPEVWRLPGVRFEDVFRTERAHLGGSPEEGREEE